MQDVQQMLRERWRNDLLARGVESQDTLTFDFGSIYGEQEDSESSTTRDEEEMGDSANSDSPLTDIEDSD
ncbi:hypothetical protein SISSUDRAFT_1048861 [Sistotremastrum suecicum HHB10207 ss-3]|uniref:Uncharacterized protein n=1 Tax=Sistotremastrum suecicum HHB10207 ss-3 TaxID=1314776 RepID=A0A166C612_9AGAM|nr:hypothetical protein SISSUDRAFT_1048861 [Sistotremastrum suecicum HHB10207 ss-3]